MSPDDAVAVIGHQSRKVDLSRYLDADALSRVANYVTQLDASGTVTTAQARGRTPTPKRVVVQIAGFDVGDIPGLTTGHANEAKAMAAKVYPVLYVFENSARDVISSVLKARVGPDWWNRIVPEKPYRSEVARRMKKEGDEAWHSKRSGDPLQYVDLPWLADIVRLPDAWPHFKPIFIRETWFESIVDDLNVSRRVLAHMNPLTPDDIKSIETGFRKWVKQLQAKESDLP